MSENDPNHDSVHPISDYQNALIPGDMTTETPRDVQVLAAATQHNTSDQGTELPQEHPNVNVNVGCTVNNFITQHKVPKKKERAHFVGYKKKYFTGREKELANLETIFAVNEASERAFCAVSICGTGGYGKTALAAEYAQRHEAFYMDGVMWIACDSLKHFSQMISDVTLRLGLEGSNDDENLSLVTDWLIEREDPILLVVDNVDEEPMPEPMANLLSGSWRDKFKGHMLITTRRQASDVCHEFRLEETCCMKLQTLQTVDSMNFLFHQSQVPRPQTEDDLLTEDAELLCKELGNLPLAIEQSGSYIKKMNSSGKGTIFSQYRHIFQTKKAQLIEKLSKHNFKASPIADKHSVDRLTIQTAWIVNFEHIQASSKAAAYTMLILSFFDVSDIPCCLLDANPENLMNPNLEKTLERSEDMGLQGNEIQDYLTEFSLFYHDKENDTLSVHPLIQFLMREEALNSEVNEIFHDGTSLLGGAFNDLKVLPTDILGFKEKGVSIYNMPSIYHWGRLAHHSDVFISHIIQHQESEMDQHTECVDNLLLTFYSHSMSKVLYEVASHLSINGGNEKAIMYRNMAIKVASFWNEKLPFENTRADIPFTFQTTTVLKTCLLSKAEKDEIGKVKDEIGKVDDEIGNFKGDQDLNTLESDNYLPLPQFQGNPCSIASKCRNHVQNMNKSGDLFFMLARSRCNAALACSDIQQTHDTGCKCSDILEEKPIETSNGQTIEIPLCIHKQEERQYLEDVQIIVLKKGIYDLSKYAKPSVENTHFIGVKKDECIFVTPGAYDIILCGNVHFENVTLNCSNSLVASERSIVSFSNCKFQSAEKISDDVVNSMDENNVECPYMLKGYPSTIFILDSQANVKGGFLYTENVTLTIQRTNILGNHCEAGILLEEGSYLNLYEVDIESFEIGLAGSCLPLGKCHIHSCNFHHHDSVGVMIFGVQAEHQVKAEFPDLILSKNLLTDNGTHGACILGCFSVLIENNVFSRNLNTGLICDMTQGYGQICENVITNNGDIGLELDPYSDIELVGNTINDNPITLLPAYSKSKVTMNELPVITRSLNLIDSDYRKEIPEPMESFLDGSLFKSFGDFLSLKEFDANKGPEHVLGEFLKKIGFQWTSLSQEEQIWLKNVSDAFCTYQLANRDGIKLPFFSIDLTRHCNKEMSLLFDDIFDNKVRNTMSFYMWISQCTLLNGKRCERILNELFPLIVPYYTSFRDIALNVGASHFQSALDPLKESKELAQLCPNCLNSIRESHSVRCESCRVIRYCSTLCCSDHCKKHKEDCIKIQEKYIIAVDIDEDLNVKMLQLNHTVPVTCSMSGVDKFILRPYKEPKLEIEIKSEKVCSIVTAFSNLYLDRPSMGVTLPARLTEDESKLLIYYTDIFYIDLFAQTMNTTLNHMLKKTKKPLEFVDIELD